MLTRFIILSQNALASKVSYAPKFIKMPYIVEDVAAAEYFKALRTIVATLTYGEGNDSSFDT